MNTSHVSTTLTFVANVAETFSSPPKNVAWNKDMRLCGTQSTGCHAFMKRVVLRETDKHQQIIIGKGRWVYFVSKYFYIFNLGTSVFWSKVLEILKLDYIFSICWE